MRVGDIIHLLLPDQSVEYNIVQRIAEYIFSQRVQIFILPNLIPQQELLLASLAGLDADCRPDMEGFTASQDGHIYAVARFVLS
jgi:hypothetical protein